MSGSFNDPREPLMAVFLAGLGGFLLWIGFKYLRRKRLIENMPTSKIRSLAMGLVELNGRARTEHPLKAPLSGVECCYFQFQVEREEQRGKNRTFVTVAKGNSGLLPFSLVDETGVITVDPSGLELDAPPSFHLRGTSWPPHCAAFLAERGISGKGLFFNRTMRFREWRIGRDQAVYLIGTAKKDSRFRETARQTLADHIRSVKRDTASMARFDTNKDGMVDGAEWDAAVAAIEKEYTALQAASAAADTPETSDVVIGRGETEQVFIASDKSEKDLVTKYTWVAGLSIAGGIVLAAVFSAYIIQYFSR